MVSTEMENKLRYKVEGGGGEPIQTMPPPLLKPNHTYLYNTPRNCAPYFVSMATFQTTDPKCPRKL